MTRAVASIAAVVLCLAAGRPSAEPVDRAATAAWEAVLRAKGGSARLDAVRTVALSTKSPQPLPVIEFSGGLRLESQMSVDDYREVDGLQRGGGSSRRHRAGWKVQ